MSRWFRFHADAMRNPKVLKLSDKDFRFWVNLMAIASENDGTIPALDDLRVLLRVRLDHLKGGLERLIRGGLIDALDSGYEPHSWNKFQYKSDTSSERVAKHRTKCNVSVTPPDTETDTEDNTNVLSSAGEPAKNQELAIRDPVGKPKRAKAKTTLPDLFKPLPFGSGSKSAGIVAGWSAGQMEFQLERFRSHHRAKGSLMADWQGAWGTWVLNTLAFGGQGNGKSTNQTSDMGVSERAARQAIHEIRGCAGRFDGDESQVHASHGGRSYRTIEALPHPVRAIGNA